jgi:OmpA-OmpF porin, OOP family
VKSSFGPSLGVVGLLLFAGPALGQTPPAPPADEAEEAPPPPPTSDAPPAPEAPAGQAAASASAPAPPETRARDGKPDRWAVAPNGSTGLLRSSAADSVTPGLLRLSLGLDFFSASGVIRNQDDATRIGGVLALSGAPIDYLELWLNVRVASAESSLNEPQLLQTVGDLGFGAKGFYPVADIFSLGAEVQLDVLTDIGGAGYGGVRVQPRFLTTLDLQKLAQPVPFRTHFNVGYLYDGSEDLADEDLTLAEQFALGVSSFDRLVGALSVEAPLRWVSPYLEYSIEIPLAYRATPGVILEPGGLQPKQAVVDDPARPATVRVMPQRLTPGVRVTAVRDFTFDVAVEIGLTPDEAVGVPVVPPYNVVFLASYALDAFGVRKNEGASGPPVSVPVIVPAGPGEGGARLSGTVSDEATGDPLADAIVRFDRASPVATDESGQFRSPGLEPGPLAITVTRPGYEDGSAELELPAEGLELQVELSPSTMAGTVSGEVRGPDGPVAGVQVALIGEETVTVQTDEEGRFVAPLPEGRYRVIARAPNRLADGASVKLSRGESPFVGLRLREGPGAQVEDDRLRLDGPLLFAEGSAEVSEAVERQLAAAVDFLLRNPSTRIRVEGHADGSAGAAELQRLSRERAEAVVALLVRNGVPETQLDATAFGDQRPVAPSETTRGRAQNNRVELAVVEAGASARGGESEPS